jgi:uncharacterized protein (DUF427 family)
MLMRGVVPVVLAMVTSLVTVGAAPQVGAAPGVGVSSVASVEYWDGAQQARTTGYGAGYSVAVAADGTVLVTGEFDGTMYFPRSAVADDSFALTATGSRDVFVAALNADDSYFAWAQRAGGAGGDAGQSVAVDDSGTVLVTGYFQGTAYFPRSAAADDSIALTATGYTEVFVAALNADDSYFAWAQRAAGYNEGQSVAVAPDGTVLVTGNFQGTAYFPRSAAADDSFALTATGSTEVFVAALNADDSYFAWAQRAGGTSSDTGSSVAVAADGTVLVTGYFQGTAYFPRSGVADDSFALTAAGSYGVFVAALNADDSYFAWAQRAGSTGYNVGKSVAVDDSGTVLVTGTFEGTAYFPRSGVADDSIALTATGPYEVFVAALNADDSYFSWAQRAGGGVNAEGFSVAVAADGTVLVTGELRGTAYFPRSAAADDSIALTSAGPADVFVAALNADDSYFAWAQRAGGTGYDAGKSVAVDDSGTVLVTGLFFETAYFPRSADDSFALTASGTQDDLFVGWLSTSSVPPAPPGPPGPTPTPGPAVPPGAPTGVSGVAGDGQVSVSWASPVSPGSFAITSYQVAASPGGKGCVATAPTLTCDVTGLTNGTPYTFEVRALNGAGWGLWSSASAPVTPQAQGTLSIVIAGARGEVRGVPGVIVSGISTGLGQGAILRSMVRFPGQTTYTQGSAQILVDQDGAFTWQRRTGKKTYVYVETSDGTTRSNRVVIPAQ